MRLFNKNISIAIFDLDGVIVEITPYLEHNMCLAAQQMENESGIFFDLDALSEYLHSLTTGSRGHQIFSEVIKEIWPKLTKGEIESFRNHLHSIEKSNPYPPVPGAKESLNYLYKNGVGLILCTNNTLRVTQEKLESVGIRVPTFRAICASDQGYHKPDPRILDNFFRTHRHRDKDEMVYFGDWWPDLELCKNTAIDFVAVLTGGVRREVFLNLGVAEDHILNSIAEIPEHGEG